MRAITKKGVSRAAMVALGTLGGALGALGGGCSAPSGASGSLTDAGPDVVVDSGPPPTDAGPDVVVDSGPPPADAAPDVVVVDSGPLPRVFLTQGSFNGDLRTQGGGATGLEGGDNLCAAAAAAAGLPGTFKAWLSDATTNAIDRLVDVGGWYNVGSNPSLMFGSKAAITGGPNGGIADEQGNFLFNTPWTGTRPNGTAETAETDPFTSSVSTFEGTSTNCQGWTASSLDSGAQGAGGMTGGAWTEGGLQQCQNLAGLYCFQQ
jgi:hypothetical protein